MRKTVFKTIILLCAMVILNAIATFSAGWVNDGGDNWMYVDADGIYLTSTIRSSGNDKYYLDEYGNMVRDYLLEDYNDSIYYFDDSGKMVTNTWVAVDPSQIYNPMDNPPTVYLYYFGSNGKAYKSRGGVVRKTIDGKKYLFNENGQMLSGWINEQGDRFDEYNSEDDPFVGFCYYAGDETDGVLREGWTAYEEGSVEDRYYLKQELWFYFLPSTNKKVQSNKDDALFKKIINGKTYAFDDNGVMAMGWDSDLTDPDNNDPIITTKKYYMEEGDDVGRLAKKEWVFAVPSMKQNLDDHDQEIERWFYSVSGGDVVKGEMRKINNGYYVFNAQGIMQTGICVIDKATKRFVDCIDAEKTDGRDFIISRFYISKERESAASEFQMFNSDTQLLYYFSEDPEIASAYGKRDTGERTVAFGDDDYLFTSQSTGEYEGFKKKYYYQAGIKLKPDPALGIGLVFLGYSNSVYGDTVDYAPVYNNSTHAWAKADKNHNDILTDYVVTKQYAGKFPVFAAVGPSGSKISKGNSVKKDKSGNYWLIGQNGYVINIFEVPIRRHRLDDGTIGWQFKSEKLEPGGTKVKSQWINFGTADEYGKTCNMDRTIAGRYALKLDETYCVNFRIED